MRQIEVANTDSYRGMYNQSFPERCWSPDGKFLLFTSPCKSSIQSYVLKLGNATFKYTLFNTNYISSVLESSQVFKLPLPDDCTGSVILDVLENFVLISGVSLTQPDRLFIGRINYANVAQEAIAWKCLSSDVEVPQTFSLSTDVASFKVEDDMEYEVKILKLLNIS